MGAQVKEVIWSDTLSGDFYSSVRSVVPLREMIYKLSGSRPKRLCFWGKHIHYLKLSTKVSQEQKTHPARSSRSLRYTTGAELVAVKISKI